MTHDKSIHRFNLTPRKQFQLWLCTTPICSLCYSNEVETYLHSMWDCPDVKFFGHKLELRCLIQLVGLYILMLPLNDSSVNLTFSQKIILFLGPFLSLDGQYFSQTLFLKNFLQLKQMVLGRPQWKPCLRQWKIFQKHIAL